MPNFSLGSRRALETCHPDIQRVFNEVIKHWDCRVLEGARSLETQAEYVRTGKSKTLNSRHIPAEDGYSYAVDVVPYPIDWNDRDRFLLFIGKVLGVAKEMGVDLVSGVDWDGDGYVKDHTFFDAPHFQIGKS